MYMCRTFLAITFLATAAAPLKYTYSSLHSSITPMSHTSPSLPISCHGCRFAASDTRHTSCHVCHPSHHTSSSLSLTFPPFPLFPSHFLVTVTHFLHTATHLSTLATLPITLPRHCHSLVHPYPSNFHDTVTNCPPLSLFPSHFLVTVTHLSMDATTAAVDGRELPGDALLMSAPSTMKAFPSSCGHQLPTAGWSLRGEAGGGKPSLLRHQHAMSQGEALRHPIGQG
jgi:hypothetical protein